MFTAWGDVWASHRPSTEVACVRQLEGEAMTSCRTTHHAACECREEMFARMTKDNAALAKECLALRSVLKHIAERDGGWAGHLARCALEGRKP
jgi:hypothetical protein